MTPGSVLWAVLLHRALLPVREHVHQVRMDAVVRAYLTATRTASR